MSQLYVQPALPKTWPLVNEFCWNWVQLTQPLKSIGFGIKVQSVFWSSRRRRLPRTEQEMIWTNQKLPLMIHVLWPGFPFSFSLCSGPMRKDCCFDSAVQEVLCITWEVSDREIAWVVPKPLTSGYVFKGNSCNVQYLWSDSSKYVTQYPLVRNSFRYEILK